MKHPSNPDNISVRSNQPQPYLSQHPWTGFTQHDRPREKPLAACPSSHCRRARACLAAHDNLYCQRTHFSPAEIRLLRADSELGRALAAVPKIADPYDLENRKERITRLHEIRLAHHEKMTARWKAGEFDRLYGAYSARGVLLKPPPKVYMEGCEKGGA